MAGAAAVARAPPRSRRRGRREDAAALAARRGGCHGTGAFCVQAKGQREGALLIRRLVVVVRCIAEAAAGEEGASVSVLFAGVVLLIPQR